MMRPASRRSSPAHRLSWRERNVSPGLQQLFAVGLLVAATTLLAAVHLAAVARPAFLVGAVGMAIFYIRRSPFAYLTLTLWFWSIAPFARRLVDFYGGFVFTNIMLIAPNAAALLMLKDILRSRELWRRQGAGVGLLALGPVLYGMVVSFVQGDVTPGLISAADWLTPMIYYYYILNLTPRIREAESHLQSFVALNLIIVASYSLYQYVSPPPWDVQWVLDSKMITNGQPVPFGLKPFSTLNSPATNALWIAMLLILSLHYRNTISLLLLPVATFILGVSLVRTAMGVAAAGLAGACVFGRAGVARSILPIVAGLAVVVAAVSVIDPKISEAMISRVSTVNDLSQDLSAQARVEIYQQTPGLIDMAPFGQGIGSFGRGARDKAASAEAGVVDSGPLEIFLALGWVPGALYVAGIVGVTLQAAFAARAATSPSALPFAMAALATTCAILMVNLVGLAGITIWLSAGLAIAIRANERLPPVIGSVTQQIKRADRISNSKWAI